MNELSMIFARLGLDTAEKVGVYYRKL